MNSALNPKMKLFALLGVALVVLGTNIQTARAQTTDASAESVGLGAPASTTDEVIINNPTVTTVPGTDRKLSEPLQELVKMAERGLGDDVLIAWINNSPAQFNLTSDEIVYLTDLGISEVVIKTLINHKGTTVPLPNNPAVNPAVAQTPSNPPPAVITPAPPVSIAAAPEFETAPQMTPQASQVVYVEQPEPVQNNYFYSSLAPYGSWIEVADYGLCWRPTVAVIDTGWRPYSHRGRWLYTNCGWYWQSDYSWGWAPFHYGRWWQHPSCGWVWAPGATWAPAWVTWRYSDAYCGWAPLPPGAHYRTGVGLTYFAGAGVSLNFDFGLGHNAYTFVPTRRFYDRAPWRYALPSHQVVNVFNQTTVINNFTHRNSTLVNEGPGRDRIAAVTRSEVQKVTIRDLPTDNHNSHLVRSDRLEKGGKELAVFRPLNPTLSNAAAAGTRHEIPKDSTAAGLHALKSDGIPSVKTATDTRTATAKTVRSIPATSLTSSERAEPSGTKPGAETRQATLSRTQTIPSGTSTSTSVSMPQNRQSTATASRVIPRSEVLKQPAPNGRAINPPLAAERRDSSSTVALTPSSSATIDNSSRSASGAVISSHSRNSRLSAETTSRNTSPPPIAPPLVAQRPVTSSRSGESVPAPPRVEVISRSFPPTTPAFRPEVRQEVSKPVIANSPQQAYSVPPSVAHTQQAMPAYPVAPRYNPGPNSGRAAVAYPEYRASVPVPVRGPEVNAGAPRSAPHAVSGPTVAVDRSYERRSDRNTR